MRGFYKYWTHTKDRPSSTGRFCGSWPAAAARCALRVARCALRVASFARPPARGGRSVGTGGSSQLPDPTMASKRPSLIGLAAALPLLCPTAYCYGPSGRSNVGKGGADRQQLSSNRQDEIILPSSPGKPDVSVEESTFWRSVPKRRRPREDEVIPYNSNLDADGPLPFGAYRVYGKPKYEPKRTCVLSVALDFAADYERNRSKKGPNKKRAQLAVDKMVEGVNINTAVRNIQRLIDAGFSSFQVTDDPTLSSSVALQEWADESVFAHCESKHH